MTACKDSLSGKKAVSATLAGVLAVGMVPAAAFAETAQADTTTGDEGVSLQVAPEQDAFNRGTIAPSGLSQTNGAYSVNANADGTPLTIGASTVTPLGASDAITVDGKNYTTAIYAADADGNATGEALKNVYKPGKYVLTVTAGDKTAYKGGVAKLGFTVKACSLSNIAYYEANPNDAEDTGDTSLYFTGNELNVQFYDATTPKRLVEGTDYTVKILKKGTDNVPSAEAVPVKEVGEYVAYVTGIGQYAGETAEVPFEVKAFRYDLATVEVNDVIASDTKPAHPDRVYFTGSAGYTTELDPSLVSLTFVSGPDGSKLFDKPGAYNFKATYGSADKSVTVNKVEAAATFGYDGGEWKDSMTTYLNDSKSAKFDATKIEVKDAKGKVIPVSSGKWELQIVNATTGAKYNSTTIVDPGIYKVTVKMIPLATSYTLGGSATCTVTVKQGLIDADVNVFVYDENKNVITTAVEKNYDTTAINTNNYTVKAFTKENVEIADANLTKTLYGPDGKVVSDGQAVDAGTYTLKISSDKYELTGTTEVKIVVNKINLKSVDSKAIPNGKFTFFDIDAIDSWANLQLQYNTGFKASKNDEWNDGKGKDDIYALSFAPNQLDFQFQKKNAKGEWEDVDNAKAEGDYRLVISPKTNTYAKNYDFATEDGTAYEFTVANYAKYKFDDVKPGDWAFDAVASVSNAAGSDDQHEFAGYMNGYNGTTLFGPSDTTTRGMMACVLFNMAKGGGYVNDNAIKGLLGAGYNSYDDVATSAYYAEAVAWAKQAGIVHGYGDGSTFGPDDAVTREQFATMLANFAEKYGKDTAVDVDKVLASMPDGKAVSDWAKPAVAWAVDAKIMGNAGVINPSAKITRAEVACMVYNYASAEKLPLDRF